MIHVACDHTETHGILVAEAPEGGVEIDVDPSEEEDLPRIRLLLCGRCVSEGILARLEQAVQKAKDEYNETTTEPL